MNPSQTAGLHASILKTVAYFEVFSYPLSEEQIFDFLPQNSVTKEDVRSAVAELIGAGRLIRTGEFVVGDGTEEGKAARRMEGERFAAERIRIAKRAARVMKCFPFVRAVFLTGSLSKNVSAPDDDIDFMIVTAPERLWICRTMLTAFRKIFLLGSSKYFCTNFYVTETSFRLPSKNLYTAVETATVKPLWNRSAFADFIAANVWIRTFLPNVRPQAEERLLISPRRSFLQRWTEMFFTILPAAAMDRWLMELHRQYWQRQFPHLSDEEFSARFLIARDVSSGWPDNVQQSVLSHYQTNVRRFGVHEDV